MSPKEIAEALKKKGFSVWWDPQIPPGKTFDDVIKQALNKAKCVVVLWSENSIKSRWVLEEANVGERRKILVPAKIDSVEPPFGFTRIHAADLTDWDRNPTHQEFENMLDAIISIAGPQLQAKKERSYLLYLNPPKSVPKKLFSKIIWDSEKCFLRIAGKDEHEGKQRVFPVLTPGSRNTFEIEIPYDKHFENFPITICLTDNKNNDWVVGPFYIFKIEQQLRPADVNQIRKDWS